MVMPGDTGTLPLVPVAGGGKRSVPPLMQRWPEQPLAHAAGAGEAPWHGRAPWCGSAPTAGLVDGGAASSHRAQQLCPGESTAPPSRHAFEREDYAGLCRHRLRAGQGAEESPGALAPSCSQCRGHRGAGTELSWGQATAPGTPQPAAAREVSPLDGVHHHVLTASWRDPHHSGHVTSG